MKESQKCDSLWTAFKSKSLLLNEYTEVSLRMLDSLESERKKSIELIGKLQKANDDILKIYKNPFKNANSLITGGLIGFVLAVILLAL